MVTPSSSLPIAPMPRQEFADELRGFALLGIIFVNAPFLGISADGFTADSVLAWYDRAAAFAVIALAQAKFYLLFAFLFGYSMHFIVKEEGATSVRRFRRRLLGLGVLGIAHAALLFVGDILFLYAVLGVTLIWMRRLSDRVVMRVVVLAGIVWVLLLTALPLAVMSVMAEPAGSFSDEEWIVASQSFNQAMREGSFFEASAARISFWTLASSSIFFLNGLGVLAAFALGLVAGRRNLFARPELHRPLWQSGLRWGLSTGLCLGFLSAWLVVGPGAQVGSWGLRETAGIALGFAGAPLLSWGYVSVLATMHAGGVRGLAIFRPAGRMSLSCYIGESLMLSLVFCAYGLGLFGKLNAGAVSALALGTWIALDLLAKATQSRWASGPLESLLRRFSAG
ncbi:DUF418 domain-containing protein [Limnohabitans sp. MMS-10A-178]|uniref:DUF418 domain-containing protein n=1 Tax=Limnohabitans sp. MMS-10A-178 TaxID=1835767 RepID=UPI000D3BE8F7|nr:DUF418 domain-containing protein [Limnohabitans sp. MMS-10A-178]PUE17518.1 hypothetical protein B9Z32_08575 [Limnohabitans sp. MMS-10A-178]